MDDVWETYKRVWSLAEETCPVQYSGSLGADIAGGYSPSEGTILLGRHDGTSGLRSPQPNSPIMMKFETCVIIHELSHAHSHRAGGDEYEHYMHALRLWNYVNMDGTVLNDRERKLIFAEETRVETRGVNLMERFAPSVREQYSFSMLENLAAYSTLLWTGHWPDGRRQRWEDSSTFETAMKYAKEMGMKIPPPRTKIGKEPAGW